MNDAAEPQDVPVEGSAEHRTKVFFIAGEQSGDALGASLINAFNVRGGVDCLGVGGVLMERAGLKSLLPMSELCVMGIWEIVWQARRLLGLIHGMVEEIERAQPDVLVTIDLPDFNFRVAQRLKKRGIYKGKIVHYVAPSVWAWRPGRAKKVSQFLDGLMCLFPFEPKYFEKHALTTEYVGHPIITQDRHSVDRQRFRVERNIVDDEIVVGLFLGSREREVDMHASVLLEAIRSLREHYPNICLMALTTKELEYNVHRILEGVPEVKSYVIAEQDVKWSVLGSCDVAIAVSGTVGLELAYMNVPHVIAYKTHPISALMIKTLAKIKYAHLVNLLLDKPSVPELLQTKCTPLTLTKEVFRLIKDDEAKNKQRADFKALREQLNENITDGRSPSDQAARFVLKQAGQTWI